MTQSMLSNGSAEPPSTSYSILPYETAQTPLILDLLQVTLGNSGAVRKTAEFWQWKHASSPFGASYGLYAWDEAAQAAIGLRVLMRWQFRHPDGRSVEAVRAVDTATHPAYQRRGIFSTLTQQAITELAQAGVHLIFNTPNQKSLPGYLKMGWQVVTRWPLTIKPLRPLRMLARRLRPQPAATPSFAAYFKPGILSWAEFSRRYGEQAAPLAMAWEAQRCSVGLRTQRSWSYLSWRYGEHPHVQYAVFPYEEPGRPGQLAGFAVMRPNLRYGWQEVVLTELFLCRAEAGLGRQILTTMAREVAGDYLIAHFAQNTVERKALRQAGFLQAPRQGITFTVRPLQTSMPEITAPTSWDLTLGDLELF